MNDLLEVKGIYDPGSQVTVINSKLVKVRHNEKVQTSSALKSINGRRKTNGLITLKAKILNEEKNINAFILESDEFDHDLLLGLDTINKFRLTHNEDLNVIQQKENKKDISTKKEETINLAKEYEVNFNEGIDVNQFTAKTEHLHSDQRNQVLTVLNDYNTNFAKNKYDVGKVKNYEAFIDLQVEEYCNKRPYRCSIEDRIEIEKQVAELLKHGLIEESYGPFAAPVTLAYKRDEGKKTRLCIDFRELNKIIIPQFQPFPLIEDLMLQTTNCKYFTTLDINSAFWSIPLRISDKTKTGFVTQEGHYQWTCLPFGLKTSPAIFQRILRNIIKKHNLSGFAVNYIDDILIFSKTFDEHITHLRKMMDAIQKEGFRLKFTKCTFAANSAKYLGHIIKDNTITPLKDNLKSIREFPTPQNRKNVRQFLGKINFHGKFIPNASITLEPLHNLLRKNTQFHWSNECQNAFDIIKNHLCSSPILAIFDPKLPISIYTDASIQGLGAVLKQTQLNGEQKPVAYFSKKLNDYQKTKKAIFLECLAIKECLKFWQHWLLGNFFTVYTDHKPLEKLNVKNRTDEELGDMIHYLSQYNFKVKYNPGKTNKEADCLSRNPVFEEFENMDDNLKTVNIIKLEDIKNDQAQNQKIKEKKNLIIEDEIYYKRSKKRKKILLSEEYSKILLKKIHENFCHIGINQMEAKVTKFYTAPNLRKTIETICKNCEICIRNKTRLNKKYGKMSHLGPAERPFQIMSLDTIGGFGGQRSTKKYLHLLVDHFTRFAYILCSRNQNAQDFIKILEKVPRENTIETLFSDQYPALNSNEFKEYLNNRNIKQIFTAIDAPFSNGLNERLNQTLINRIRCRINEKENKSAWSRIAEECVQKYNETDHTVTGFPPKYLLSGESTDLLPLELKEKLKYPSNLQQDRKIALQRTKKYHDYNKSIFDKNRIQHTFKEGELVYVSNGNKLNKRKMDEIRIGPFKIIEKVSNSIYKLDTGYKKRSLGLYHITKLIPMTDEA